MWKIVKVVPLPTNEKAVPKDCIGKIFLNDNNIMNILTDLEDIIKANGYFGAKPHDLYFLSDEEIKEGDWCYDEDNGIVKIEHKYQLSNINVFRKDCKKIITTTDKSLKTSYSGKTLISENWDGELLPQPSQSFIEKFVEEYNKGNVITQVLVEYETITKRYGSCSIGEGVTMNVEQLKVSKNNTINIKPIKESWNREEVRQLLLNLSSFKGNQDDYKDVNQWIEENL